MNQIERDIMASLTKAFRKPSAIAANMPYTATEVAEALRGLHSVGLVDRKGACSTVVHDHYKYRKIA